jgi:hypothetical protein
MGLTVDGMRNSDLRISFQMSYNGEVTGTDDETEIDISEFSLEQNYPNPFNPVTMIKYTIPQNEKRETKNVTLIVYDILGNKISTLVDEQKSSGSYEVKFNGNDLSSGIYFYQLKAGDFISTKKMLLIK